MFHVFSDSKVLPHKSNRVNRKRNSFSNRNPGSVLVSVDHLRDHNKLFRYSDTET